MPKTTPPRKPHGLTGRPSNARKSGGGRSARLTIRIPADLSARIDSIAAESGVTRSDAAIAALERGIGSARG